MQFQGIHVSWINSHRFTFYHVAAKHVIKNLDRIVNQFYNQQQPKNHAKKKILANSLFDINVPTSIWLDIVTPLDMLYVLNYELYCGAIFILQNYLYCSSYSSIQKMNLIVLHAKIRCLNTPVQTDQTFFISPYLFPLITYLFQIRKLILYLPRFTFHCTLKSMWWILTMLIVLHWQWIMSKDITAASPPGRAPTHGHTLLTGLCVRGHISARTDGQVNKK